MRLPLYLDYNATTPTDPAVLEAMLPYFTTHFGNPASGHAYGWQADEAVKQARERVGALFGGDPRGVVFTSGATEALTLALRGLADTFGSRRPHLVTVATEHKAVLEGAAVLAREGYDVTTLGVGTDGVLDLDALRAVVTERTLLVAVMWANNETGVLQPVRAIADIAHAKGAFFLTDATQALGKVPVDVEAAGVDLLACSGHKFYAPKGVGALWMRLRPGAAGGLRVKLAAQHVGGSQEGGLRAGTLNVPGIVGLGKAAELARALLAEEAARLATLRDDLEQTLAARVPGVTVHGATASRLPQTSNLRLAGVESRRLLPLLRGLACSTGAACQTKVATPSHVLTAMGVSPTEAATALRLSLGRYTTDDDVARACTHLAEAVHTLRGDAVLA